MPILKINNYEGSQRPHSSHLRSVCAFTDLLCRAGGLSKGFVCLGIQRLEEEEEEEESLRSMEPSCHRCADE